MRPEYDRKLGKWTLSTHVLPVYAISLSLSMFTFDTTTWNYKTKTLLPRDDFFSINWEILNNRT
jgi:hypothetical protein